MLGTTGLCTIDKTAVRVLSDSIFYILHSLWLNILNFILEDSLNIIFEELIGKMRRILKLERIRTEWETYRLDLAQSHRNRLAKVLQGRGGLGLSQRRRTWFRPLRSMGYVQRASRPKVCSSCMCSL